MSTTSLVYALALVQGYHDEEDNLLMLRRLTRLYWIAIYYGIATHLPCSYEPLGGFAKWLRGLCARHLLHSCGTNVNIERHVNIGSGRRVTIGHNSGIGPDSTVQSIRIGDDVMIGPQLFQISQNHISSNVDIPMTQQGISETWTAIVESDCWIGARVTMVPGAAVGTGTIVGAGAVVTRSLPPESVCAGNPARVVRSRTE